MRILPSSISRLYRVRAELSKREKPVHQGFENEANRSSFYAFPQLLRVGKGSIQFKHIIHRSSYSLSNLGYRQVATISPVPPFR